LKNHYQTLGLLSSADDVVIKAAYKALAQKYHPDKHKSNQETYTKRMADLNAAFAVLGTKASRKKYDQLLEARLKKTLKPKESKDAKPAKTATSSEAELIKKLNENTLDEMVVLELFEKLFACKVKINSGWMNTYAYKVGDKTTTLDFLGIKTRIVERLNQNIN